jgi:hypothetical protein
MDEMWPCPQCHSLNYRRDQHCYKCGLPQGAAQPSAAAPSPALRCLPLPRVVARSPPVQSAVHP